MRRYFLMFSLIIVVLAGLTVFSSVNAQLSGRGNPPAEALAACDGKVADLSCAIKTPHGIVNGTCKNGPRAAGSLICVPENGQPDQGGQQQSQQQSQQQGRGGQTGGSGREHTVTQSNGLDTLYPATQDPIARSEHTSVIQGDWRILTSNAISEHKTGAFPNSGNPHRISEQNLSIRVPARPRLGDRAIAVKIPGWAFNGVPFDPGAGEFYKGDRSSGWQYNALSGAVALGLDESYAHVQPSGKYHYHGLPTLLMKKIGVHAGRHSPQIGWAADGFPIYALYGYNESKRSNSGIAEMHSSYRLKGGERPRGGNQPGGTYDGTFVADFEYVEGAGELDECNGRWTVTPDYPNGTYAYFLSHSYPVVPRCVKGDM